MLTYDLRVSSIGSTQTLIAQCPDFLQQTINLHIKIQFINISANGILSASKFILTLINYTTYCVHMGLSYYIHVYICRCVHACMFVLLIFIDLCDSTRCCTFVNRQIRFCIVLLHTKLHFAPARNIRARNRP